MHIVAAARSKGRLWVKLEAANSPAGTLPVMRLRKGETIIVERTNRECRARAKAQATADIERGGHGSEEWL